MTVPFALVKHVKYATRGGVEDTSSRPRTQIKIRGQGQILLRAGTGVLEAQDTNASVLRKKKKMSKKFFLAISKKKKCRKKYFSRSTKF